MKGQGRCPNLADCPNLPDSTQKQQHLKLSSAASFGIALKVDTEETTLYWLQIKRSNE